MAYFGRSKALYLDECKFLPRVGPYENHSQIRIESLANFNFTGAFGGATYPALTYNRFKPFIGKEVKLTQGFVTASPDLHFFFWCDEFIADLTGFGGGLSVNANAGGGITGNFQQGKAGGQGGSGGGAGGMYCTDFGGTPCLFQPIGAEEGQAGGTNGTDGFSNTSQTNGSQSIAVGGNGLGFDVLQGDSYPYLIGGAGGNGGASIDYWTGSAAPGAGGAAGRLGAGGGGGGAAFADNTYTNYHGGAGGGGGGGKIIIVCNSLRSVGTQTLIIQARGGAGGQARDFKNPFLIQSGSGGGGGGGTIQVYTRKFDPTRVTFNVQGGQPGFSNFAQTFGEVGENGQAKLYSIRKDGRIVEEPLNVAFDYTC